jgi:hypothetical protein
MHNFFKKLGIFIENRRLLIIIVSLILMAALLVFGVPRLTTAFGTNTNALINVALSELFNIKELESIVSNI